MSKIGDLTSAPANLERIGHSARRRVLLVLPAYNEERSLPVILAEVRRECPWADVVIVNDGSRDDTELVAQASGYQVLSLPFNLGIGGAVQTGFKYAAAKDYDVVVQVDADGQHLPGEVEKLIAPVLDGRCDVAIGSRFLEDGAYRAGFFRTLGIRLLARIISMIVRKRITDPTSGFRAYGPAALASVAHDYPYDYPEPEALVTLSRRGLHIVEVPARMRARLDGISSIGLTVSIKYMFKVLLAIGLSLLRSDRAARERVREGGVVR